PPRPPSRAPSPPRRPRHPRPRPSQLPRSSAVAIINKPWGHEQIWAKTERYVGKVLHIRAGEALSLQYHRVKDETIMLLRGRMQLVYFADGEPPRSRDLVANEPFHITPGLRHRMIAIEDTDVLEVSTPELDDVVRLEDRYGRIG